MPRRAATRVPSWVPLWVHSAVRRPATAAALVLVAGLTVLTAVTGPLLVRAVDQAGLRDAVTSAGPDADLLLSTRSQELHGRAQLAAVMSSAASAATSSGVFAAPRTALESADGVRWQGLSARGAVTATGSGMLSADDGCHDLVLTAGVCAVADDEVVVADSLVASGKLRLGQAVFTNAPGQARGNGFTVVGVYDAARAGRLLAALSADSGVTQSADAEQPFFVPSADLTTFTAPIVIAVRSSPLPGRLDLDALPAAHVAVEAVRRRVIAAQAGSVSYSTGLPDVLAAAAAGRTAAGTLVFVTTAQAVALALAGALGVMALVARGRTGEWALGRLRGVPRHTWLGLVLAEPLALTAIGAVAGFAGAWAWCELAIRWVVPGGGPLEVTRAPVLVAAGIAVAGLLLAPVVASHRGARAPLATLLGEAAEPGRPGRVAVAAESMLVVLAVAAGSQLLLQPELTGTAGTLALLAPGLLAAALALLAIRVATAVARRRSSGPTASLGRLLVVRPLARTPSRLQRQVPVAVGVALLVFATQLAVISTRNQHLRAGAQTGAASVLRVAVPPGADLEHLVRAADPSGTQAMAVQERAGADDSGVTRMVAVDSSRLAAVSLWRPGWAGIGAARLATILRPSAPAPITLRGRHVRVTLAGVDLVPDATADPTDPPVDVDLVLVVAPGGTGAWQRVRLGSLTGSGPFAAALPCPSGCRLVRWELDPVVPTPFDADLTLTALSTDVQPGPSLAGTLRSRSEWHALDGDPEPGQPPQATATASDLGLRIRSTTYPGDTSVPTIAPADEPDLLPAVVASGVRADAVSGYPGTVEGVDLDGQPQLLKVVAVAGVLPRSMADGVLVDLATAQAVADPGQEHLTSEVWLAASAGPAVRKALQAEGVRVLGVERVADADRARSRETPSRAVDVDLAVAGAALVLLVVVLAGGRVIDAGHRRTVWRVGRLSGLSRRGLARIVAAEVAGPAAAAALIGAVAGVVSVVLAGTALPLTAAGTVGPPLDVSPAAVTALAVTVAVLVLVALVAVVVAAVEARGES